MANSQGLKTFSDCLYYSINMPEKEPRKPFDVSRFEQEQLDPGTVRDAEMRFALELLDCAKTGAEPSPEAAAYQQEQADFDRVRPFRKIENCVHGIIRDMGLGFLTPDQATEHFDKMMKLFNQTELEKRRTRK